MDTALLEHVTVLIDDGTFTWTELASGSGYSKTAISRWKNKDYDSAEMEAAIRSYADRAAAASAPVDLSFRDSLRLTKILALIDEADDPRTIRTTLTRFGERNPE